MEKRLLDRELSDVSTVSHLERGSQGSLRRASSLEHVISSDHSANNRGRLKSAGSGKSLSKHATHWEYSVLQIDVLIFQLLHTCKNNLDILMSSSLMLYFLN